MLRVTAAQGMQNADFLERRQCELRRIPKRRSSQNSLKQKFLAP